MKYVSIYRAPNINTAWIMQDYFVTNGIDATIAVDTASVRESERCGTEDAHFCPSFVMVPEDRVEWAAELLKQYKLI